MSNSPLNEKTEVFGFFVIQMTQSLTLAVCTFRDSPPEPRSLFAPPINSHLYVPLCPLCVLSAQMVIRTV